MSAQQGRDQEQQAQHGRKPQEPAPQDEHRDRQDDACDRIEDERHTQHAAGAVEDEEQMYPAGREKEDGAEDAHDPHDALVAFGHSLTRFRSVTLRAEALFQ